MLNYGIAFVAGFLTGLVAALFGVGGGVLAIPVMVFLLGLKPPVAVATNSVIIVISTSLSAFFHWRQGTLRKEGIYLGLGGVLGSFAGNALFFYVSSVGGMRIVLGISFILIGLIMLTKVRTERNRAVSPLKLALTGILIGTFAGLVGMSGGVLLNPVLVLMGFDIKQAIGLSVAALPIITVASAVPKVLAGYANLEVAVAWVPGVILGTKAGAAVMKKIKSSTLKKLFALFMIGIGIRFLT